MSLVNSVQYNPLNKYIPTGPMRFPERERHQDADVSAAVMTYTVTKGSNGELTYDIDPVTRQQQVSSPQAVAPTVDPRENPLAYSYNATHGVITTPQGNIKIHMLVTDTRSEDEGATVSDGSGTTTFVDNADPVRVKPVLHAQMWGVQLAELYRRPQKGQQITINDLGNIARNIGLQGAELKKLPKAKLLNLLRENIQDSAGTESEKSYALAGLENVFEKIA